jgi:hypothetical protein
MFIAECGSLEKAHNKETAGFVLQHVYHTELRLFATLYKEVVGELCA